MFLLRLGHNMIDASDARAFVLDMPHAVLGPNTVLHCLLPCMHHRISFVTAQDRTAEDGVAYTIFPCNLPDDFGEDQLRELFAVSASVSMRSAECPFDRFQIDTIGRSLS